MDLETRIRELSTAGNKKMAERLIRGVIGSADPEDIDIDTEAEQLTVHHSRFSGVHQLTKSQENYAVSTRGDYVFTGKENSLNIELTASNSRAIELAEKQLHPKGANKLGLWS